MGWLKLFHNLVIPFLGVFAVTLAKLVADQKLLSLDESNDIALEMVLLAVGALGAFYSKGANGDAIFDAGVVDVFLGAILIYMRWQRGHLNAVKGTVVPVGWLRGMTQLFLGVGAIIWTIKAF